MKHLKKPAALVLTLFLLLTLLPLHAAAAPGGFGLRVCGMEVTPDLMTDVDYFGPRWSFDGQNTLSVWKNLETQSEEFSVEPYLRAELDVIDNYEHDGLVVRFDAPVTLTVRESDPGLLSTNGRTIHAGRDTTLTGAAAQCFVYTDFSPYSMRADNAIDVDAGATLTILDTELQVSSKYGCGIRGWGQGARLVVDNATLTVQSAQDTPAVYGFGGGIELKGCAIVEPVGGRLSDDGSAIVNADGSPAHTVVIQQSFGLRILDTEVTLQNKDDVLGNGVFSFDGSHTLTVRGSFTAPEEADCPIITNYHHPGLIIRFEEAELSHPGEWSPAIEAQQDTTLTGGSLRVRQHNTAVNSYPDAALTVKNMTLDLETWAAPIVAGRGLVLSRVTADLKCTEGSVLQCYNGRLQLKLCQPVSPAGATISENGFTLLNPDQTPVTEARIEPLANPFRDVAENKYYYEAVLWAYYHEPQITGGTGDGSTFSPNDTCTRAQVVTFLYKANGAPEVANTANPFTDVRASKYYYTPVLWAYWHNPQITGGVSANTFGPNRGCTREQVVTFLWKAAGAPPAQTTENPFTDVSPDKYYYRAVLWAVENGITSGMNATTFGVGKTCTRAQIVTFLYAAYGNE